MKAQNLDTKAQSKTTTMDRKEAIEMVKKWLWVVPCGGGTSLALSETPDGDRLEACWALLLDPPTDEPLCFELGWSAAAACFYGWSDEEARTRVASIDHERLSDQQRFLFDALAGRDEPCPHLRFVVFGPPPYGALRT